KRGSLNLPEKTLRTFTGNLDANILQTLGMHPYPRAPASRTRVMASFPQLKFNAQSPSDFFNAPLIANRIARRRNHGRLPPVGNWCLFLLRPRRDVPAPAFVCSGCICYGQARTIRACDELGLKATGGVWLDSCSVA